MSEQNKPVMTAQEVMEVIPNRYPMFFVDRVEELDLEERIVATKNVAANESYFQGHFPGNPIMPGVLQVETMAQVGSIPLLMSPNFKGKIAFLAAVDKVKFRRNVVPGDVLTITVDIVKLKAVMGIGQGTITNQNGDVVSEAKMTFIISDLEQL
ncbi:3-hydroxyacyl-[acyl-carrier-protein] dehydratase [Atopostipes suicloacalis DSM 15692]|uniref:3-hydroxyacyl-[acyl-carrier-protein] dehydratase n=1 Tax=Atopostipes suicloacalis DSM 15692 TaxID=1121025 RepID=A0A1M4UES9_9LACT|nr:3-hydroxyacyl-ACP dehydratase FabZ [Atopostipes suicloacalis]SHE55279.1 3-hydroxyacyl-[acyl-carrier-protein] dehydratase [Atopostipes suicloacalis DSM 15692]